ncbi:MAG: ABC transporter ATP-binding protein [Burkholderiales bacterium]|nr:ABC transporter ATP-binding protein [Burkholderiales bacterium]
MSAVDAAAVGAPLLRAQGLNAWYGAAHILFDVDLEVRRGEVVALMGLLDKRRGTLGFMGHDISRSEPHEAAALGLGFVPEDRRIFTDLTVLENLEVGRQAARHWSDGSAAPHWTPERLFELFPNLGEMPNRPGGRMSGGEQQMLTIARSLMGNPYLILLDEPSEGVAPLIVEHMAHTIRALKAQGVSVLLSEQNMHFAERVADRAYVLEKGQIRCSMSMEALSADEEVRSKYLSV